MKHIRDTPELFKRALHDSEAEDESDRKTEGALFIDTLKQLQFIDSNGTLKQASDFYDPSITIFKLFVKNKNFPPKYLLGEKWLDFLRKIGLKIKATEEEFISFCEEVASGNHKSLLKASKEVLRYLFMEESWHEQGNFLMQVAQIPFVCDDTQSKLTVIVPQANAEKEHKQGNKVIQLTSLCNAGAKSIEYLVWSVMPIVSLPKVYYPSISSKQEREAKSKQFHEYLGVCREPSCEQVIHNIQRISNSHFNNFELFHNYVIGSGKQANGCDILVDVLAENFLFLSDNSCQEKSLQILRNSPCIPVCAEGNIADIEKPVLVPPEQVVASGEVAELRPFLNPLPIQLFSSLPMILSVLGVNQDIQFANIRLALEIMYKCNKELPLDSNSTIAVKKLIKRLYY